MDARRTAATSARYVTLVLLLLAGLVNFLDRSSLSIANPFIRSELHLSGTQMGALLSAFSLAYGVSQLPVGPLLDRLGSRLVLGAGLGVWSLAQVFSGGVGGMRRFLFLRAMLGCGEAPFFPASVKLVRESFTAKQRGRVTAAVNISTTLGQGLAPPLLTALMLLVGWRQMFVLIGGLGLLLAVAWFGLQRGGAAPMLAINSEPANQAITLKEFARLFGSRTIWGLMLGFGGINYASWFYIGWLPVYLQREHAASVRASGWFSALPFLAGALGMFLSGVLADRQARKGVSLPKLHRRQILIGMLAGAAFTLFASRVATTGAAVGCISAALFSIHFAGTSAWGYVQAISPGGMTATVGSMQNFGSFMVASAAPLVTGWLLDRTHSFMAAFVLCAVMTTIGAGCYAFMVGESVVPGDPAEV